MPLAKEAIAASGGHREEPEVEFVNEFVSTVFSLREGGFAMTAGQDLRERREVLVRKHMQSENDHDFEVTLSTRLVCERVYFDAATILSQLGLLQPAPSLEGEGR